MARRKELKNIAQGMVSSFVSRNNDFDGYWELAKLYDLANQNGGVNVTIDLLKSSINPSSKQFEPLILIWRNKLLQMLESRSIQIEWVKSAVIVASFKQDYIAKLHRWGAYGEPCTCRCAITTDNGALYTESAGTKCMPFSRAHFQRSSRRKNF